MDWVKDVTVDFKSKTATVKVDSDKYKEEDLLKTFEGTKYKGTVDQ